MAKRSLVGKLWGLAGRMRRSGAISPMDKTRSERHTSFTDLIDPTKYNSVEELSEAIGPLMDQHLEREYMEFQKKRKVYQRNTRLIAFTAFGSVGLFGYSIVRFLAED
ncbi:unnamed protein product [Urochloa humidicola]